MSKSATHNEQSWQPTACMLCSIGCAIEVQTDKGHITKVRGDKSAASSEGYLCQKAARLDHYQNHSERLHQPLKRLPDGSYQAIGWDQAIREIAEQMKAIKAAHGGHAFAYYGGGGQGNHLGGTYSGALRAALGTPYVYSALAQEKTGDFWINGKLFGRQSCFVVEGMEHADYAIVLGANPWAAHGVPKTRDVLKAFQKDPGRTMVVIDPRRTETAAMADIHLQVKPGRDAWLLSAIIATIFQEGLEDKAFLESKTTGFAEVKARFAGVSVAEFASICGINESLIREVARGFAKAERATVRADLGIQHSPNSTLNSYLEKLLFLVTGNFNRDGGNHLVAQFAPLIGHSGTKEEGEICTRVTGMVGISKLFPPNILPLEIDTDHPERVRALIVDSANPALSGADARAYRQAFSKLDLLVCIDVAMTETARQAHYVLPAQTQFEKAECAFFTFGFPVPYFHLRRPLFRTLSNTLPEAEIYRRLVVALGEIPERFPVLERLARLDRRVPASKAFALGLAAALKLNPQWTPYVPVILYATLGKALPENMASAATLWGVCQFFAARNRRGVQKQWGSLKGYALGERLFQEILANDRPVPLAQFTFEDTWKLLKTADKKIHLYIPEMNAALENIKDKTEVNTNYPLILMAGERRSYNANQIFRTPDWRKTDKEGAMRIHPDDLAALGLQSGEVARCVSQQGAIDVSLSADDTVQPGMVTLPHGYGMWYQGYEGQLLQNGPAINELTRLDYCDPIAKTPLHKHVPVRLEAISQ
ncbi:MAG: molybdopterin-dependent oxidoreductase [Hahellaceae bacterium]|nr:molybdopterin-dependent oxidoreductase [Hahellaceae bacterium]